jgi:hypothetical protein
MYREYAADPVMRINLGIRRRLAPLLNNSRRDVWRTLRRNRKEREFRLKRLSLVQTASADWREAQNT